MCARFLYTSPLLFMLCLSIAVPVFTDPGVMAQETSEEEEESLDGLLGIARVESRKESRERDQKIKEIILQLGIYSDPELDFVRRKRSEILAYGSHAVPLLIEAMETVSEERTRINAGRIAATILARINDPRVEKEAARLLDTPSALTRANAIVCLGEMGLTQYLDKIRLNLTSKDERLLTETIRCMGQLKSPRILEEVAPFLNDPRPIMRMAALEALHLRGEGGQEACEAVLQSLEKSPESSVLRAALGFIHDFGGGECVDVLIKKYGESGTKRKVRYRILETLTAVGVRMEPASRGGIITFMKTLLNKADYETVKKAAYHLYDLGDDSGVKVLTGSMDNLIARHGNAEYYFRRGEIYLQFRKYKEAKRDFLEGLRKDKKAGRFGAEKVYIYLARCLAAEDRFLEAERYIRKAKPEDPSRLPLLYEEFREMAKDERYSKVFQRGGK